MVAIIQVIDYRGLDWGGGGGSDKSDEERELETFLKARLACFAHALMWV